MFIIAVCLFKLKWPKNKSVPQKSLVTLLISLFQLVAVSCSFSSFQICSCIYNCGPMVIPSKRMIIESSCVSEICKAITGYHWALFKHGPANTWVEIEALAKRILTDLDNPSLVLSGKLGGNEYSLEMNATYKVNGTITLEDGSVLADFITFRTVAPLSVPVNGCNIQPVEGVVFATNFTVNCSGWYKENANLRYQFRYVCGFLVVICNLT